MSKKFPHNDEQIRKLITSWINKEEKPGERAGGSGHLGQLSYRIFSIDDPESLEDGWKVCFKYEVEVFTEFTYLPDNPPHRYMKEGFLVLDEFGLLKHIP